MKLNKEKTLNTINDIECLLKSINEFKSNFHFSLDIYYNDMDDTFVAKVSNFGNQMNERKHFRNKKLGDSLLKSHDFISDRSKSINKKSHNRTVLRSLKD